MERIKTAETKAKRKHISSCIHANKTKSAKKQIKEMSNVINITFAE